MLEHFKHISLTESQKEALLAIQSFVEGNNRVFLLKGYAGSGKTTLIKGLVDSLRSQGKDSVLCAPTGRAAKVMQEKIGEDAYTIHKTIYSFEDLEEIKLEEEGRTNVTFKYHFKLLDNTTQTNSIFIVDESSMVSDQFSEGEFFTFGSGKLLQDLIEYTRIGHPGTTSKIIFVGDPAQLPPIGMNSSPALTKEHLEDKHNIVNIQEKELTEVKRANENSGILKSSKNIRQCITSGLFNDFDLSANETDMFNVAGKDFLNTYNNCEGDKVIVTYKNETSAKINEAIRKQKFGADKDIRSGDQIIVSNNNYKLKLMNGEFGVVVNASPNLITRSITPKGNATVILHWREIELMFPVDNEQKIIKTLMLENFLHGGSMLSPDLQHALYIDFIVRHSDLKPKSKEFDEALRNDPFFNAIHLKYGYSVTCHKAQGGEWENVFVFWDRAAASGVHFINDALGIRGNNNESFYRWAYTAVTRASSKLYCINPPKFNSYDAISFVDSAVADTWKSLTGSDLNSIEIVLDKHINEDIQKFNLKEENLLVQDFFIGKRYLVNKQYIDIVNWERYGEYEIHITFKREEEQVCLKFWHNAKYKFKDTILVNPKSTNSDEFAEAVISLLKEPCKLMVKRNTVETVIAQVEWESSLDEKYPFLKTIYEKLNNIAIHFQCQIESVIHNQSCERYQFVRGGEKVTLDFWYKDNGMFSTVNVNSSGSNSSILLEELKQSILNLKAKANVV